MTSETQGSAGGVTHARGRFSRRRVTIFVLVAAVVAVVLGTASTAKSLSKASSAGGTLTIATFAGLGFDTKAQQPGYFEQYLQPVYDQLLRLNKTGAPIPYLATSWTYNAKQTVLTLHLRSGVKFTDGTPFNAQAVKTNLLYTKSGTSTTASQLKLISGIQAVGTSTVIITLSSPDPSFLPNLGGTAGMMASPKAIAGGKLSTQPVGSGPYELDAGQTTAGATYTFTRNPNYWNKQDFPFDTVVLKVFTDPNAELNGLRSGQLSGARLLSVKDGEAAASAGLHVYYTNNGDLNALDIFDKAGKIVPALANVKVRQAINYAINRKAIVQAHTLGKGYASDQIFSITKNNGIYDPALEKVYPYDPAKARQLLAQAGYAKGFSVTMPDFTASAPEVITPLVQELGAVGIKVTLDPCALTQCYGDVLSGKYAMSWLEYDDDRPWDATQFRLIPTGAYNPLHYSDPTVNKLVNAIRVHPAAKQRLAYYRQLNKYLVTNAWSVPLGPAVGVFVTAKNVTATQNIYSKQPALWTYRPS